MKKIYNIPTVLQLSIIAENLNKELSDIKKDNLSIVFEFDKDQLRQIDEDYFFKNNKDADPKDFEPGDLVEVIVSGIKFKFIEKKNDDQEEEV